MQHNSTEHRLMLFPLIRNKSGFRAAFLRGRVSNAEDISSTIAPGVFSVTQHFCQRRRSLSLGNLTLPVVEQEEQKVCASAFGRRMNQLLMSPSLAAPGRECRSRGKCLCKRGSLTRDHASPKGKKPTTPQPLCP